MRIPEVVVIGGGISGLSTCYYLSKMFPEGNDGIHLTLLESGNRLGGKVLTVRDNDCIIEGGPDSFFTQKPWALNLCNELELSSDLMEANPETKGTYILNKGKLSRLPEGTEVGLPTKLRPFVSTDIITPAGKLRALLDLIIPGRKTLEDESIGDFMGRRFGKQFVEKIVEPLYAGIYAGDVYHLSANATLPSLKKIEIENGSLIHGMRSLGKRHRQTNSSKAPRSNSATFVTLRRGMLELIEELEKRMPKVSVNLDCEVKGIKVTSDGKDQKYRIDTNTGNTFIADAVIISLPAYSASRLITDLNERVSKILKTIPYVSTATVSLAFPKPETTGNVTGHGFLVPRTENELVTGCTWESAKWTDHAPDGIFIARCYLGKFGNEKFMKLNDEEMVQTALDFLKRTAGIYAKPIFTRIFRWNMGLPQYTVGHLERIREMETELGKTPGLFMTGAAYRGVGLPDCIHNAELTAYSVSDYVKGKMPENS